MTSYDWHEWPCADLTAPVIAIGDEYITYFSELRNAADEGLAIEDFLQNYDYAPGSGPDDLRQRISVEIYDADEWTDFCSTP